MKIIILPTEAFEENFTSSDWLSHSTQHIRIFSIAYSRVYKFVDSICITFTYVTPYMTAPISPRMLVQCRISNSRCQGGQQSSDCIQPSITVIKALNYVHKQLSPKILGIVKNLILANISPFYHYSSLVKLSDCTQPYQSVFM